MVLGQLNITLKKENSPLPNTYAQIKWVVDLNVKDKNNKNFRRKHKKISS